MFENLTEQAPDQILALMHVFQADPRENKVDLGVGVYKDASGNTPIMRAVKTAERRLLAEQTSKSYVGLVGDPAFADAMISLVLGDTIARNHIAAAATVGGTGAVRQALELAQIANPEVTIWISNPTWPNHPAIIQHHKIPMATYRYFDPATRAVDFPGMLEDLNKIAPGDVVLLHGCCHNPTGANLTLEQMGEVVQILKTRKAVPLIDIAYQGFGDGLDADAEITRAITSQMDECLIAASCSKNFGVYRERVGILMVTCRDAATQNRTQETLSTLNRLNYSFPPDHGARVITMILNDPDLRADWQAELEEVRLNMLDLRQQLADKLRQLTNSDHYDFLATHRGMFSLLGISPEQVEKLRVEDGIYMIGDSRMNIAGLNAETIPILAQAIAQMNR